MSVVEIELSPRESEVEGLPVRRVLPKAKRRTVGPFIFVDHMGPATGAVNVGPHPHIGLATVTWLFDGMLTHRDSLGFVQDIRPGDVNWMTAGKGIAHSERGPEGRIHGIQTWVALPKAFEDTEPAFHHHPAATLPGVSRDSVDIVVIAGKAFGEHSPVTVFSDTLYCELRFAPGASLRIPAEHEERAIYLLDGSLRASSTALEKYALTVFRSGGEFVLSAGPDGAQAMLLGGAPLDGERYIWWNFVASDQARIDEAKRLWQENEIWQIPGESGRIALPTS